MKNSVLVLLGGAMASLLGLPSVESSHAQNSRPAGGELRERDDVRRNFRLAAGARVEVSSIRGTVEVETADGDAAEVHVVRSARSRADLEQFKVVVEQGPQGLVVRGEQSQRTTGAGLAPEVRHHVMLRLPRDVSLSVQSVSGDVRVGDISGRLTVGSVSGSVNAGAVGGRVQVSGVSGGVSVGRAGQGAEVSSVSGGVSVGQAVGSLDVTGVSGELRAVVSQLGEGGVRVSSVSGRVELRFGGELNAELSTDNVSGELALDVPNVAVRSRPNASALRAVIGRGGPAISINGVSQGVRLAPAS